MTSHGPSTGDTPVTSSPQVPFVQGHSYLDPEALVTLFESVPGYNNGTEPSGSSHVVWIHGYRISSLPSAYDLALCKLAEPLGNPCGWMGAAGHSDDGYYTSLAAINITLYQYRVRNPELPYS